MTRAGKKFIKQMMARGYDRNTAHKIKNAFLSGDNEQAAHYIVTQFLIDQFKYLYTKKEILKIANTSFKQICMEDEP